MHEMRHLCTKAATAQGVNCTICFDVPFFHPKHLEGFQFSFAPKNPNSRMMTDLFPVLTTPSRNKGATNNEIDRNLLPQLHYVGHRLGGPGSRQSRRVSRSVARLAFHSGAAQSSHRTGQLLIAGASAFRGAGGVSCGVGGHHRHADGRDAAPRRRIDRCFFSRGG